MLYWHKIEFTSVNLHQSFDWQSGEYTKLVGVLCSPNTELSLTFNNGKKVFVRQLEFRQAQCAPNKRIFFINKKLNKKIIIGVLSIFANKNASVYFLLEK